METPRIVRTLVWLRRIGHCKGFGVQSPSDYSLVRNVINETMPYYCYSTLSKRFPDMGPVRRKIGEFGMRLANFVQPTRILSVGFRDEEKRQMEAYLHSGCKTAKIESLWHNDDGAEPGKMLMENDGPHLLHLNALHIDCGFLPGDFGKWLHDGDYILVDNMNSARSLWDSLCGTLHNAVSFDMYYCGLLYVDSKRYKQNYIINF